MINDELLMGFKKCGSSHKPLMIAEEGQAHDGDHELALRMIDLAAAAGADGVEFQLGRADDLYIREDHYHQIYVRREFSLNQINALVNRAHEKKLIFQVAALSPALVKSCADVGADSFCVNAMDIDNPEMLEAVATSGKPFWIATLMSNLADVDWAVDFVRRKGATSFGLLHGQHIMTSSHGHDMPPEVMQLDCIEMFRQRYRVPVGYVDHTSMVETPALVAMRGACVVFKHLAPRENWRGPDWEIALTPDKWFAAKAMLDKSQAMLGATKEVGKLEAADQPLHRRSLRLSVDAKAGSIIQSTDLVSLRPGGGISPKYRDVIAGRRLTRDVKAHEALKISDIEGGI